MKLTCGLNTAPDGWYEVMTARKEPAIMELIKYVNLGAVNYIEMLRSS